MATSTFPRLHGQAVSFLENVYSPELALYPFSTSVAVGQYVNDYRHQPAIRYTINSLLGLQEAARATGTPEGTEVRSLVDAFLRRQYAHIQSYADLGLLLVLLQEEHERDHARDAMRRIAEVVGSGAARHLDMQSLGWMLWGLSAAAKKGAPTEKTSAEVFDLVRREFVNPESLLPRHSNSVHRRWLVSFGAIVYFLRSLHEYASLTGDNEAHALFSSGVERMIGAQGPQGEWPWLFSVRSGRPVEPYPVFAVHQDSMAMLFLLPALEAGLPTAGAAIERSLAWVFGENELGTPMYTEGPFRAYRSIHRMAAFPRATRYVGALASELGGRRASFAGGRRVRVNHECRSYHLGWLLYTWSSRRDRLHEIAGGDAHSIGVREHAPA